MRPLIACLLLSCGAACATEPGGLRLDLQLDKTTVTLADSVRVTLTLSNVSVRPFQVLPAQAYGICSHAFQVYDGTEREVTVNTAFCALALFAIPDPVALWPGQSLRITDAWKPGESWIDGQPLPSGTYRLRGRVSGDDRVIYTSFATITVQP